MDAITLHYRRIGNWPSFDASAFEVVADLSDPKLRAFQHGKHDRLPGPLGQWMRLTLPASATMGMRSLQEQLDLNPMAPTLGGHAVLVADAIALYRAVCRHVGWPDTYDPAPWVDQLPDAAHLQRATLHRVCAAPSPGLATHHG